MQSDVLALLACPRCGGDLHRAAANVDVPADDLACSSCRHIYRVRNGIAELLVTPPDATAAQFVNRLPPTAWAYERVWRPFALSRLSGSPFPPAEELSILTQVTTAAAGGVLLDLACGNGFYARELARCAAAAGRPAQIIAIDHSLPMLIEAQQRARQAAVEVTLLQAAAQQVPLKSGCVDAIAIGGSWNEIGAQAPVAAECARLLRPGGRLLLMYLQRRDGGIAATMQALMRPGGLQFPREDELIGLFGSYGLRPTFRLQRGIVTFNGFVR
jgi:SAM-dependent methyltransferase